MENSGTNEITNEITFLREWSPLSDLLGKIPSKIQKGIFYQDLNVTCVDILSEFIALGTDAGVVLWYNRISGDLQKLRCEYTTSITCLKVISSVEYMVAAGTQSGQVSIFQIQKEHPPDLNLVAPITKIKPIERYTIRELNLDTITALEWSKNGMKLFSGDRQGIVVLTELDFIAHISKSIEILNEAYAIVQLGFIYPWLLVSTTYRAIVCTRDTATGAWGVSQIGKKDRKVLSQFGAVFTGNDRRAPSIVCSRPGFRFWLADTQGNVSHTFLLKDAVLEPAFEVPLLNPGPNSSLVNNVKTTNFGLCHNYNNAYILTHSENTIYIINLEKLKVVAMIRRLRKIQYLATCGWEIFILEGGRSLIRLSIAPEQINSSRFGSVVYNAKYMKGFASSITNSIPEAPIEFEAEEEAVINADECFELPPIEQIHLETPLQTGSPSSRQDKMLLEHSRRVEVFERINQLEYDNSILFKTGLQKVRKKKAGAKVIPNGIVEVGHQAVPCDEPTQKTEGDCASKSSRSVDQKQTISSEIDQILAEDGERGIVSPKAELTTTPFLLEASFCEGYGKCPPVTLNMNLRPKEERLAAALDLEPVTLEPLDANTKNKVYLSSTHPPPLPDILYKTIQPNLEDDDIPLHATIVKKLHFIQDDESIRENDQPKLHTSKKVVSNSDREFLNGLTRRSANLHLNIPSTSTAMTQSLNFVSAKVSPDIPVVKRVPDYMHIPNLWNARIEREDDNGNGLANGSSGSKDSSGSGSSEWEFL